MSNAVALSGILLLVCLFMKVPVFASLMIGSLAYFVLTPGAASQIIAQRFTSGIESISLLAVPFYICAGVVMNYCGITSRIMDFATVLTRRLPGGLAQVNIVLSTLMGGLSGSSMADAAMEAKMLVPEMEKSGLPRNFSAVVTAFSATITPLIPPGIQMVLYGTLAGVSIGKMFLAGLSLGLLICAILMLGTGILARYYGFRPKTSSRAAQLTFAPAFKTAALPLCLPIVIIGGIRIGVFTPTEAGAVAVVYGVLLGIGYRKITRQNMAASLYETITATGTIGLIIGAASVFAWILTREQVPQHIAGIMVTSIRSKYLFLIIVNIFLLIVGMFIEGTAATIVLAPLLAPIARSFGIDDVQFAFIFIFNSSIGNITPPMGILMFIVCAVTDCKTKDFLRASVPYFIMFFVILLLVTFCPVFTIGILDLFY